MQDYGHGCQTSQSLFQIMNQVQGTKWLPLNLRFFHFRQFSKCLHKFFFTHLQLGVNPMEINENITDV